MEYCDSYKVIMFLYPFSYFSSLYNVLIDSSLGCLVASVSVASSPVTSDEIESISIEIVENSLELFNTILTTIRQSTRAGGHVLQNYIMMGAWVLTSGLLVQLASAMETSPTTTKPRLPLADLMSHGLNLNKVQQRFNVLSVALASEALTLTSLLLEDLSSEMASDKNEGTATLDLFTVSFWVHLKSTLLSDFTMMLILLVLCFQQQMALASQSFQF